MIRQQHQAIFRDKPKKISGALKEPQPLQAQRFVVAWR